MNIPRLTPPSDSSWQLVAARIMPGHQVASGQNGNPLFPGGTLKMQAPFFNRSASI
jgi:hypothetical protein